VVLRRRIQVLWLRLVPARMPIAEMSVSASSRHRERIGHDLHVARAAAFSAGFAGAAKSMSGRCLQRALFHQSCTYS